MVEAKEEELLFTRTSLMDGISRNDAHSVRGEGVKVALLCCILEGGVNFHEERALTWNYRPRTFFTSIFFSPLSLSLFSFSFCSFYISLRHFSRGGKNCGWTKTRVTPLARLILRLCRAGLTN